MRSSRTAVLADAPLLSDALRRGDLQIDGLDLAKPEQVKERIFGKILRVDRVEVPEEGPDPLTRELTDFVAAVRTGSRPRVTGGDALRAVALADRVLRSLNEHHWEGISDGPTGPLNLPEPAVEPIVGLAGPKVWKYHGVKGQDAPARAE